MDDVSERSEGHFLSDRNERTQSPQARNSVRDATLSPEMQDLAEQIGEFIHYWGFKRVHGRIWTHLFLAHRPLDAADLVRQMKISKALISISLRELLEFDVVQEVGKSARGTHLYRTNPDILSVILSVLRQREKRMLARVNAAHEVLKRMIAIEPEMQGISSAAIDRLGQIVDRANLQLDSLIALRSVDFGDWREAFLTIDPQEEASIRARSVVAPSSPRTRRTDDHEVEQSDVETDGEVQPKSLSAAVAFAATQGRVVQPTSGGSGSPLEIELIKGASSIQDSLEPKG